MLAAIPNNHQIENVGTVIPNDYMNTTEDNFGYFETNSENNQGTNEDQGFIIEKN